MEMELQDYQVIDHCLCVKLPGKLIIIMRKW